MVGEYKYNYKMYEKRSLNEIKLSYIFCCNNMKVLIAHCKSFLQLLFYRYYQTERESCEAFAKCLQEEVNALVDRGCKYIQIDEPLIARKNEAASEYGIGLLSGILKSLPPSVSRYYYFIFIVIVISIVFKFLYWL